MADATSLPASIGVSTGYSESQSTGFESQRSYDLSMTASLYVVPLIQELDLILDGLAHTWIPSEAEAVSQYLAGVLPLDDYRCIVGLHGVPEREQMRAVLAQQQRLDEGQLVSLWRRGEMTEGELDDQLRHRGWIDPAYIQGIKTLSNILPGPSDLIQFMTRDVVDEEIWKGSGVDEEFPLKWTGKLADAGYAQGIGNQLAKWYWRAHYQYPAIGQVYEAIHRLRPTHSDYAGTDLVTVPADAERLLAVNDMIPSWRKRLVELSYSPLTRVDAKRAYIIGSLDEEGLLRAYLDLGYNEKNAKTLVDFSRTERIKQIMNHYATKQYIAGVFDEVMWVAFIQDIFPHPEELDAVKYRVNTRRTWRRNWECIKLIKAQYRLGKYDNQGATEALSKMTLDPDYIRFLVNDWGCQKLARGKEIPAAQLCKWRQAGVIGDQEYYERLIRLGYEPIDAKRLIQQCNKDAEVKAQKALERKAKADAAQAGREMRGAAGDVVRRNQLIKATKKVAKHQNIDVNAAAKQVIAAAEAIAQTIQVGAQEAERILEVIIGTGADLDGRPLVDQVQDWLQAKDALFSIGK